MIAEIFSPRLVPWIRRGAAAGASVGLTLGAYIDWYFARGPGATGMDAGEAYGYVAIALGFPVSLVAGFAGRPGLLLSAAISWGLLGATVTGVAGVIVYRFRDARAESREAAG